MGRRIPGNVLPNVFIYLLLVFLSSVTYIQGRQPIVNFPKDTQFWAKDFYVKGCKTFIEKCPSTYKYQHICARNYDGGFRDFSNYCEMQYENCNTWQKKYQHHDSNV